MLAWWRGWNVVLDAQERLRRGVGQVEKRLADPSASRVSGVGACAFRLGDEDVGCAGRHHGCHREGGDCRSLGAYGGCADVPRRRQARSMDRQPEAPPSARPTGPHRIVVSWRSIHTECRRQDTRYCTDFGVRGSCGTQTRGVVLERVPLLSGVGVYPRRYMTSTAPLGAGDNRVQVALELVDVPEVVAREHVQHLPE